MKYRSGYFFLFIFSFLNINQASFAQYDSLSKEIVSVLTECADYSADILLDEEGKSRCDYNLIEGKWYAYEPPWHTGQVINGLVETYKITKNEKYLYHAKRAGDWWCGLLITDHPKLKGMINAVHGDGVEDIVFATVTDGTPGLFNLYKVTGIKKYAEVPTGAGQWMLENMFLPEEGVFYDAIDAKTGEVKKENSPFWPDKKEQKLFDVSRPNNEGSLFKDMYEFTKDERYKKVFIELCESLIEKQDKYGLWMDFMPNHKEEGTYHPRFNLWYAESLLEGYDLTGDKRYLDAAKKTLITYQKAQRKEGTIFYKNYLDGSYNENSITGSAVAFAGILWIRLAKYGVGDEFKSNIKKSFDWIVKNRFSVDHPDENLRGAVINLRTRRKHGKIWMTQRDVGTSFALRFLAEYYNYINQDSPK